MNKEVDLVDIGGGNIGSIRRALKRLEIPFRDVGPERIPDGSRPLILPGVGAFGSVMQHLHETNLAETIKRLVRAGTPYLGICVGMQILFDGSMESPGIGGLGLITGPVLRFNAPKVPQIGWNKIDPLQPGWEVGYVYFVNSYYPSPDDASAVLYRSDYGGSFCAAIKSGAITAFQFHPEKSGPFGQTLLKRWYDRV